MKASWHAGTSAKSTLQACNCSGKNTFNAWDTMLPDVNVQLLLQEVLAINIDVERAFECSTVVDRWLVQVWSPLKENGRPDTRSSALCSDTCIKAVFLPDQAENWRSFATHYRQKHDHAAFWLVPWRQVSGWKAHNARPADNIAGKGSWRRGSIPSWQAGR